MPQSFLGLASAAPLTGYQRKAGCRRAARAGLIAQRDRSISGGVVSRCRLRTDEVVFLPPAWLCGKMRAPWPFCTSHTNEIEKQARPITTLSTGPSQATPPEGCLNRIGRSTQRSRRRLSGINSSNTSSRVTTSLWCPLIRVGSLQRTRRFLVG